MSHHRFKEDKGEIAALRTKEQGDWKKLTVEEKKVGYKKFYWFLNRLRNTLHYTHCAVDTPEQPTRPSTAPPSVKLWPRWRLPLERASPSSAACSLPSPSASGDTSG